MAQEDIKNLTTDQLLKKEKDLKKAVGVLIGVLSVLLVLSIYLSILQKKFNPLVAVAFALSASIPTTWSGIKKIRAEIDARG